MNESSIRHTILTQRGFLYRDLTGHVGTVWDNIEPLIPSTLDQLMEQAARYDIQHVWIHPETRLKFLSDQARAQLSPDRWDCGEDGKFISVQKQGAWRGYVSSVTGRPRQRGAQNIQIICTEQSNWPYTGLAPAQLLNEIECMEGEHDITMSGSPTTVGITELRKKHPRNYDRYFSKSDNFDWGLMRRTPTIPTHNWFPVILAQELAAMIREYPMLYVHCFDRRASYPAASAKEQFGIEDPELQEGGEFDKKKAGLWLVQVDDSYVENQLTFKKLPPLLPKGEYFLPTSLLRIAASVGCKIEVEQAIVWKKNAPVFERWAYDLWEKRQASAHNPIREGAFKRIMNNPIGALRTGDNALDPLLRPDWYTTIRGGERGVVWWKAWDLAKKFHIYPIGAYADALYYLDFDPRARMAVPTMLDHENSLGGYSHKWSIRVNNLVREILTDQELAKHANMKIHELNKIAKVEGFKQGIWDYAELVR